MLIFFLNMKGFTTIFCHVVICFIVCSEVIYFKFPKYIISGTCLPSFVWWAAVLEVWSTKAWHSPWQHEAVVFTLEVDSQLSPTLASVHPARFWIYSWWHDIHFSSANFGVQYVRNHSPGMSAILVTSQRCMHCFCLYTQVCHLFGCITPARQQTTPTSAEQELAMSPQCKVKSARTTLSTRCLVQISKSSRFPKSTDMVCTWGARCH
jgi:hypothetical protein